VNALDPTAHRPTLRLHTSEEADAFVQSCSAAGYQFVRFEVADMAGLSRGKTVPLSHIAGYLRTGLNLYGGMLALDSNSVPVRNSGYNEERNYTDCVMIADTATLTPVPWLTATGRVLCNTMWYDGTPQWALPRLVLSHVIARAAAMGFEVMMGHEYEFYVVDPATRKPVFEGQPIFVTERTHQLPAIDRLIAMLQAQGIDIITSNVEHGPGQFEINYAASVGVHAADQAFVFKNTVKEYLRSQGLLATFMTKPYQGLSGSCCHFHVSLLDRRTGLNLEPDTQLLSPHQAAHLCALEHQLGRSGPLGERSSEGQPRCQHAYRGSGSGGAFQSLSGGGLGHRRRTDRARGRTSAGCER